MAIWQSSTPARGTLMPGNEKYNVVAFGNERISAMRTEITLIKKSGPNPAMSKRISLDEQGKVCSDGSQC